MEIKAKAADPDCKTLVCGWNDDSYGKGLYHFDHIPLKDAEFLKGLTECLWIVETINWTLADPETVHINQYYAVSLSDAIALAAMIQIGSREVWEEVVDIRLADEEEEEAYMREMEHRAGGVNN